MSFVKIEMVIGIYGESCVGKSSVADHLGAEIGLPVRHCGEIVKEDALARGIAVDALGSAQHAAIDTETRSIAQRATEGLIIEGNFLDAVLVGTADLSLVNLTCSEEERLRRFVARSPFRDVNAFRGRNKCDDHLRSLLYAITEQAHTQLTIDTTDISIDQVTNTILRWLHNRRT